MWMESANNNGNHGLMPENVAALRLCFNEKQKLSVMLLDARCGQTSTVIFVEVKV